MQSSQDEGQPCTVHQVKGNQVELTRQRTTMQSSPGGGQPCRVHQVEKQSCLLGCFPLTPAAIIFDPSRPGTTMEPIKAGEQFRRQNSSADMKGFHTGAKTPGFSLSGFTASNIPSMNLYICIMFQFSISMILNKQIYPKYKFILVQLRRVVLLLVQFWPEMHV